MNEQPLQYPLHVTIYVMVILLFFLCLLLFSPNWYRDLQPSALTGAACRRLDPRGLRTIHPPTSLPYDGLPPPKIKESAISYPGAYRRDSLERANLMRVRRRSVQCVFNMTLESSGNCVFNSLGQRSVIYNIMVFVVGSTGHRTLVVEVLKA